MAGQDRTVRSLARLAHSASTGRVLNLLAAYKKFGDTQEYREHPFFEHTILNRSIILKHRLRSNEFDLFDEARTTATKILIPIDQSDLRMGARYLFVGQIGYLEQIQDALGTRIDIHSRDLRVLKLLDGIPSLDPFLLREQMRRMGFDAARLYFDISESDLARMFSFAKAEIMPLVNMSYTDDAAMASHSMKLVNKILSNEVDGDLDPLRITLQLDPAQFDEGVFCWKAFLYYKWQLTELMPGLQTTLKHIAVIKPTGRAKSDTSRQIESLRMQIRKRIALNCDRVRSTLNIYDQAYTDLTKSGRARGFRDFLLTAPNLFLQLGERLAGLEHVVSFWRYRFPKDRIVNVQDDDLYDIFVDFENGLSIQDREVEAA